MSTRIKLGFGLYRHQLDGEHFDFARQCGATHLVVHLCHVTKVVPPSRWCYVDESAVATAGKKPR